jgi:annexin A7/11
MTGDWEEIVLALMMTPAEYDAHVVREAVEGLGTSEPTLIAILCTRSAQVGYYLGFLILCVCWIFV